MINGKSCSTSKLPYSNSSSYLYDMANSSNTNTSNSNNVNSCLYVDTLLPSNSANNNSISISQLVNSSSSQQSSSSNNGNSLMPNLTTGHSQSSAIGSNSLSTTTPYPRSKMIYHCKFGEFGINDGQFTEPSGVTINTNNDIIVADTNSHRIQIFDKDGRFKFKFNCVCVCVRV